MKIFVEIIQIGTLIFSLGIILWIILSDKEKNKYHKIDFKKKKDYLCVYYLLGKENIKSNRGVLSKEQEAYLLEIENEKVDTISFRESEIKQIEITEKTGISLNDSIVGHEVDHTKAYFSSISSTTFEHGKKLKIKKYYEIKITLVNGTTISMEVKKNPNYFFKQNKTVFSDK